MATHPLPEPPSADPENERSVRQLFDAVYGTGELHRVDDLIAPDYAGRWAGAPDSDVGPAGVKARAAQFRAAFGRLVVDLNAVEVGNHAFEVRWTARGRLERPFLGVEPSAVRGRAGEEPHGPTVTFTAVTRGAVRAGELVESATSWTLDGEGVDAAGELDGPVRALAGIESPPTGPPAVSARWH